jgi:pilus assembly protein CpaF
MSDGARRIVAITEVQRMESDVVTLQDLYTFEIDAITAGGHDRHVVGTLKGTGLRPTFLEKFERRGIELPSELLLSRPPTVVRAVGGRG